MPKPKAGEEKNAYISRCVSQLMKDEGKEQEQALAICFSYWERKDEDRSIDIVMEKYLTEHFAAYGGGRGDKPTNMKCMECGKKFTKKIGKNTVEVKCPKCGSYDTDIN